MLSIISFVPECDMELVCKNWKDEIILIRKRNINVISNWWEPKRVVNTYDDLTQWMRYHIVHYPHDLYITYPERVVEILELSRVLLSVIPPLKNRKRSDVREWMNNMPFDWIDVGW